MSLQPNHPPSHNHDLKKCERESQKGEEGGRTDGDVSVMFRVAGRASERAREGGSAGSGKVSRSISPAPRAPKNILRGTHHRLGDSFIGDCGKLDEQLLNIYYNYVHQTCC